jgi:hypothetical protein
MSHIGAAHDANDETAQLESAENLDLSWLETSIADAAANAVSNVELLLSAGATESLVTIDNQFKIFESYEQGLLATWETPDEFILRSDGIFISAITERVAVTIERWGAAQMRVEHLGPFREKSLLDEIDHPLHRFALIDGVGDHPFQPCGQADCLNRLLGRHAVHRIGVILEQDNVVRRDVLAAD